VLLLIDRNFSCDTAKDSFYANIMLEHYSSTAVIRTDNGRHF
jgi:hypothetical protein